MEEELTDSMTELAERCEQATGPCRNLDNAIRLATNNGCAFDDDPRYTASIDAAMTLVPEGWRIVGICESEPDSPPEELKGLPWAARLKLPSDDLRAKWGMAYARTAALALCAAALRARAAAHGST
jgi:hypothetical protein